MLHPGLLALGRSSGDALDLAPADGVLEPGEFDVKRVQLVLYRAQPGGMFYFGVLGEWGGLFFLALGPGEGGCELGELGPLGHHGVCTVRKGGVTPVTHHTTAHTTPIEKSAMDPGRVGSGCAQTGVFQPVVGAIRSTQLSGWTWTLW